MRYFKLKSLVIFLLFFAINNNLFAQKDKYLITTLKDHSDEVHSIAISPNSKQFISGSKDKLIKIWDIETFQVINTLQRHYATIYELLYSTDGETFISGGDKTLNLWNKDGTYLKSLTGHTTAVWSAGLSSNNQFMVSGSFDNNFRLWNIKEGKTIHVFENGKKSILAVAFSKANNLIACGSKDGSIDIYTFDNFELIHTFSGHGSNIYSLEFSSDGKFLASASRDSNIKIWDLETMEIYKVLTKHERSVMSVKFSEDSRYLVSGSYDTSIKLWDVKSGDDIYTFLGHSLPVNDIDISANNKYIISASSDNTIKIWEVNPEILVEFYFEEEFQKELDGSGLFEPKKSSESRTEYKERLLKAKQFKQVLSVKYIDKLNSTK